MAKVHKFLEMWQGSQNLRAAQKESHAQNKQLTAVGYILDTEVILKASWSFFQHDGAAAFKLSERSPLPAALSANDLPGGRTHILNIAISGASTVIKSKVMRIAHLKAFRTVKIGLTGMGI